MAARPIFYFNSIKNIIVAFGSIFDEVYYISDHGETIRVPLGYAPKSKFIEFYNSEPSYDTFDVKYTLPRMGFEITGLNFASERFVNPLGRMNQREGHKFMYARIPYDFSFNLYIATKGFEDSLKIVEQIVPFFTPELTVTIQDKRDFDLKTDVPVVLNSVAFNIDYLGSFDEKRVIEWTLGFTVKAYLYSDVKDVNRIKETIVNLTEEDIQRKFTQLISVVVPRTANKEDPHTIVSTVNDLSETWQRDLFIPLDMIDQSSFYLPT